MSYYSYIVCQALKKLGGDLKNARKRRRIKMALMAERLGITRATLDRMEKGEPTVSMGVYLTALYTLDPGKLYDVSNIFSTEKDILGQTILDSELPKRCRGISKI
jgi:transcriptional regulator with XRE-family HTH domain